ncbi:MAG: DUF4136 domain-containing protein [Pseudomonas sp.]|uniref:DUF4136 domain-containing protein n=1 Tax=Pseudomonas sp. TaxID=306 RepID=UPI0033955A61
MAIGFTGPALALALLLSACQGDNPYRYSSTLPAARGAPDWSAYPAAPRDFSAYRSWRWRDSAPRIDASWRDASGLRERIAETLDRRGLRPARPGQPADLEVQARVTSEQRLYRYADSDRYSRYDPYQDTNLYSPTWHTAAEEVLVVHIELYDTAEGQQVWQTRAEAPASARDALRSAVQAALADYPPR